LNDLLGDMSWYKEAHDFCHRARSHGIKVHECTFDQHEPFSDPFKGTAGHSLDLACMHGDPAIFAAMPTADQASNIFRTLAFVFFTL
jgi:hypothetical protein